MAKSKKLVNKVLKLPKFRVVDATKPILDNTSYFEKYDWTGHLITDHAQLPILYSRGYALALAGRSPKDNAEGQLYRRSKTAKPLTFHRTPRTICGLFIVDLDGSNPWYTWINNNFASDLDKKSVFAMQSFPGTGFVANNMPYEGIIGKETLLTRLNKKKFLNGGHLLSFYYYPAQVWRDINSRAFFNTNIGNFSENNNGDYITGIVTWSFDFVGEHLEFAKYSFTSNLNATGEFDNQAQELIKFKDTMDSLRHVVILEDTQFKPYDPGPPPDFSESPNPEVARTNYNAKVDYQRKIYEAGNTLYNIMKTAIIGAWSSVPFVKVYTVTRQEQDSISTKVGEVKNIVSSEIQSWLDGLGK